MYAEVLDNTVVTVVKVGNKTHEQVKVTLAHTLHSNDNILFSFL